MGGLATWATTPLTPLLITDRGVGGLARPTGAAVLDHRVGADSTAATCRAASLLAAVSLAKTRVGPGRLGPAG